MLGKLAYRNTKRNIKDYLIYLITVTASVSLIFAFNLVASSDEIVKLCSSMDAFKNSLFAVNILIIFVICFLINYTTKFMFEKRSKELGTYMLLGIKKKEIAHLVIIENILLGILAFVLAIPIGFLFSQFVSLVIVNLLGIPKTLFISLNFVSCLLKLSIVQREFQRKREIAPRIILKTKMTFLFLLSRNIFFSFCLSK